MWDDELDRILITRNGQYQTAYSIQVKEIEFNHWESILFFLANDATIIERFTAGSESEAYMRAFKLYLSHYRKVGQ